jgi:hypothetical protein
MKRFFVFLRKYYGSLIGGAVGLLLMVVYYYLILQEPSAASAQILQLVELATFSIETVNAVLATIMGAATFLFWIFLFAGTFLIIFIHVFVTVFMYGMVGLLIHYLLAHIFGRPTVIDKNNNV